MKMMSGRLWLSIMLVAVLCIPSLAGKRQNESSAFPMQLNGTMMPFDFSGCDTVVPWGNDMRPAFVCYVARHGARYLSSEKKVQALRDELLKADSEGYISPLGMEFMRLLESVDSVTAGDWGALNPTGIAEEQELGRQLALTAPELLAKGKVNAVSSYVPRVVMTMYEVCHQLARHSSHLEITASEGRQFSPMLRFFSTDSAYMDYLDHGPWIPAYDAFVDSRISPSPGQSLFAKTMDAEKMKKLTLDMYGVLQSLPAADLVWQPEKWFSEDEYRACWEAANLKHYYQRSDNVFSNLPGMAAYPLWKDIAASIDSAIEEKSGPVGKLWFGHAETVMPLFALMRLPGCYVPEGNADDISKLWKDWEVSPLAANLLMILLEDKADNHYIAMRLNGKWINFEQYGCPQKIIAWDVLKSF